MGSGFDVVLQRSTSWVSCRGASATFGHGAITTAVTDCGLIEGPSVRRGCDCAGGASPVPRGQHPGVLAAREASSRPALRTTTARPRLLPDQGMHQLRFYVECACGYQSHEVHGRSLRSRLNRHRADWNAEFLAAIEGQPLQ